MMTESEYLYAWIYYLAGSGLLIACWWYLTRRLPWFELRLILRVVVGVAVLVPWYTTAQQEYLSPALLIAAVELLFDGTEAFWRAGGPLLTAMAVALGISVVGLVARWFFLRNKTATAE